MVTPDTADGPLMDLVAVYRAVVLFDFEPPAPADAPADDAAADGPAAAVPLALRAGEPVSVFGTTSVGFTDTATGEFWRSSVVAAPVNVLADVNVADGWCHIERDDGSNGFAPIAFLQFELDDEPPGHELPERANLRSSQHGFVIDPKPHHRLSSGAYLTSFPAPPAEPAFDIHVGADAARPAGIADILRPARISSAIHSAWSSLFAGTDAVRDFVLRGPASDPSARLRVQSSVSTREPPQPASALALGLGLRSGLGAPPATTANAATAATAARSATLALPGSPSNHVPSVIPMCYLIESKGYGTLSWHSDTPAYKIIVHSPVRCRNGISKKKEEFVSYKITTLFSSTRSYAVSETSITVCRRFTDFVFLHACLQAVFPPSTLATLPAQLPPRNPLTPRFSPEHVNSRLQGLQLYLDQIARHPLLRSDDYVLQFLTASGTESDYLIEMTDSQWLFDPSTCVISVDDGEWRRAYEPPPSNKAVFNFYERVIVPDSATYSSVSLSAFKLRAVESIAGALSARVSPLIEAIELYQTQSADMHGVYMRLSQTLRSTGRLLSRTGDDQPGCWNPSCQECGPIGDAMIAASLQLKHISEIHKQHASKAVESLIQQTQHLKQSLASLGSLTHVCRAATSLVESHTQRSAMAASQSGPASSPARSANTPVQRFNQRTQQTASQRARQLQQQQQQQQQQARSQSRAAADASQLSDIQKRAAAVLATAEAESVFAHSEKVWRIEASMASWIDDEIEKHEKILKRLRAAKEVFRGPDTMRL
ncbi:hypothetical protein HK105_206779 [Polyrhizophydium stewartii]|uniref:PX domain-containing protein n=1 Tax=Polyrhizophydium stewartii TaxID=2732419 RepID=A0ABR4N2H9_9FUNG